MTQDILGETIARYDFFPFVKWGLIAILSIYLIFASLVIRQIKLMTTTIKTGTNKYIYILGFAHVAVAATVLIGSILFL